MPGLCRLYDSLGNLYAKNGEKELAVQAYKKPWMLISPSSAPIAGIKRWDASALVTPLRPNNPLSRLKRSGRIFEVVSLFIVHCSFVICHCRICAIPQ